MTGTSLGKLRALIKQHAGPDAKALQLIPSLIPSIESGHTLPCQVVVEPVFSLVAQGAKRVEVGKQAFDYRRGSHA